MCEHHEYGQRDPRGAIQRCGATGNPGTASDPFVDDRVFRDSWFDRLFMFLFAKKMSDALGGKKPSVGTMADWEGFVDISREIMRGRNSKQQQETVAGVLLSVMPPDAPAVFRKLFPLSKSSLEINAWITTVFFRWLVGPMTLERKEVALPGREPEPMMVGVKIEKCRYLQASGCVGMCVNMCKLPTQRFFTDEFGLPLTMKPNFEDLSCEMVFGQAPPRVEDDEVYSQPCFANKCTLGEPGPKPCPKIDTDRARKARAA